MKSNVYMPANIANNISSSVPFSTALRVILLTKEADLLEEEMNTELGIIAFDDSWDYIEWTTRKKEYKK
jgi:hypothetical protein